MTDQNVLQIRPIQRAPLFRFILIGATIGLAAILFFVLGVDEPNPNWPDNWQIRPLIITPLAAAMGGAGFYLVINQLSSTRWLKILGITIGLAGFLIALWLGIVLGLDGTMWN